MSTEWVGNQKKKEGKNWSMREALGKVDAVQYSWLLNVVFPVMRSHLSSLA